MSSSAVAPPTPSSYQPSLPVVVEVVRSGFVESRHRGSVAAVEPDGTLVAATGDPYAPMLPRSANKPLQAAAMLRAGLTLDGELLALAAASHSGEPFHLRGVQQVLRGAGLTEAALQTPPEWPLDDAARLDYVRAGGSPSRLAMNCSGQHAAMLATCVVNGWPAGTYRDPGHPLQQHIRAVVADLAGEEVPHVAVDGCGAPLFALTLVGLARAYGRIATAPAGTPEGRVAAAIRGFPEWVSGTGRDEARLVRGVPGLIAKAGVEGVYAVGTADGMGVAIKVEDGSARARPVVMAATLRRLGVSAPVLGELGRAPVLGHGEPVGEVRPMRG